LVAPTFALSAIAATAAVNPKNARLETVVMDSPHADNRVGTRKHLCFASAECVCRDCEWVCRIGVGKHCKW